MATTSNDWEVEKKNIAANVMLNIHTQKRWLDTSPTLQIPLNCNQETHCVESLEHVFSIEFKTFRLKKVAEEKSETLRQVFKHCYELVQELQLKGRIEQLGIRGGFIKRPEIRRNWSFDYFEPELLPERLPLPLYSLTDQFHGEHIFWAKLLWWCAAAHDPKEFGYPSNFTWNLISSPFWFEESLNSRFKLAVGFVPIFKYKIGEKVIKGLVDTQKHLLHYTPGMPPFGIGLDKNRNFWWNYESVSLSPKYAEIMKQFDKSRSLPQKEFVKNVWKNKPPKKISDVLSKLSKKLTLNLPGRFKLSLEQGTVKMKVGSIGCKEPAKCSIELQSPVMENSENSIYSLL